MFAPDRSLIDEGGTIAGYIHGMGKHAPIPFRAEQLMDGAVGEADPRRRHHISGNYKHTLAEMVASSGLSRAQAAKRIGINYKHAAQGPDRRAAHSAGQWSTLLTGSAFWPSCDT